MLANGVSTFGAPEGGFVLMLHPGGVPFERITS